MVIKWPDEVKLGFCWLTRLLSDLLGAFFWERQSSCGHCCQIEFKKTKQTVMIHISGSDLVERKHAPSHVPWNNLHFSKTKIWTKKKKKILQFFFISDIQIKLIRCPLYSSSLSLTLLKWSNSCFGDYSSVPAALLSPKHPNFWEQPLWKKKVNNYLWSPFSVVGL